MTAPSGIIHSAVSIAILTTVAGLVFSWIISATQKDQPEQRDWNRNHIMEVGLFVSSFSAVLLHHYVIYGGTMG